MDLRASLISVSPWSLETFSHKEGLSILRLELSFGVFHSFAVVFHDTSAFGPETGECFGWALLYRTLLDSFSGFSLVFVDRKSSLIGPLRCSESR